jgi:hypothetical protein
MAGMEGEALFRRAAVREFDIFAGRGLGGLLGEFEVVVERSRGRSEVWILGLEGVEVVDILIVRVWAAVVTM